MNNIAREVLNCKECELWRHRENPVIGAGCLNASIMFIGEAPGYNEDVQGLPFVGSAGKVLDELLNKNGISRREVYISNIVKCRPPRNRDPETNEIESCQHFLDRQIRIIQPKIIVTLGRHATAHILSKAGVEEKSISSIHGKKLNIELFDVKFALIPVFHPAAALYNPKYKTALEDDFQIIKKEMEKI
jgi:uracil-DNA glycosylase family 4